MTAEWALNSKAVASRAFAERTRMALGSRDPNVRALADELSEVRESIAQMTLEVSPDDETAIQDHNRELAKLREREEALSWQVGLAGWTELRRDPWVDLKAVQDRVPEDTVLIELALVEFPEDSHVRRTQSGDSPNWAAARFLAWVIPPTDQGNIELVDLGPASETVQKVFLVHQLLALTGPLVAQRGEKLAAAAVDQELEALSERILAALPSVVSESEHWIISPDSALWLLPWGALRDDDRYVVEAHTTSYLLSGRDLSTMQQEAADAKPVIVANPDFNHGHPAELHGKPFGLLPGTKREAREIQPHLKQICEDLPEVYLAQQATEHVVKSVDRPEMLILSTHGFVFPAQEGNPLAGCGVALAGANGLLKKDRTAIGDDGLLTGLEIISVDLRGTRLVTLSACQTGVGQFRTGEGLASLRQAFHLAGAQAVAASLWPVPDQETAELMTAFFARLAAGEPQSRALQKAQLAVIDSLRKETGAANPLYWAAFTLTGATPTVP